MSVFFQLCQVCRGFLATRFIGDMPVCYSCFRKIDARLVEEKKNDVQAQYEVEKLEYWWKQSEDNHVDR